MRINQESILCCQRKKNIDQNQLVNLTRQQLRELEEKEKTRGQIILDWIIRILPAICGGVAVWEYLVIPDNSPNKNPNTYLGMLAIFLFKELWNIGNCWKELNLNCRD